MTTMRNLIIGIVILLSTAAKAQESGKSKGTATDVATEIKFVYPAGMTAEPLVTKKGDDGNTYVLITNMSDPTSAKYKIDIYRGHKKLSKGTSLMQLKATSADRKQINVGTYRFSDKDESDRGIYRFTGKVKLGAAGHDVVDGFFQLNYFKKRLIINYNLTLKNGVKTSGKYDTEYNTEDNSETKVPEGMSIRYQ
jgi:hypothetical protein